MQASVLDLRHNMKEILHALDRNEEVTILYHGRRRGRLVPAEEPQETRPKAEEDPAFGMWRDRFPGRTVRQVVDDLRKGRFDDL